MNRRCGQSMPTFSLSKMREKYVWTSIKTLHQEKHELSEKEKQKKEEKKEGPSF
jgi:hypothetical protein